MSRAWIVGCILIPLVVAGCLEPRDMGGPGAGDADSEAVSFRTLDQGHQSGAENPARHIIADEAAWSEFWSAHGSRQMPPPERPDVDFATVRVLAVVLEDKPNACWGGAITNITRVSGELVVEVTTYTPPADMMCADVITQPFHFVAIDDRATPVRFVERTSEGPPAGASDEPRSGGSNMCIEGSEDCPDAQGFELREVPVRRLTSGADSSLPEGHREVVTDQARLDELMPNHGGHSHSDAHMKVDFSTERVLVAADRGADSCARLRAANVTTDGNSVVVEVEAYHEGTGCYLATTTPFFFAAIPHGGEVHFVDKS